MGYGDSPPSESTLGGAGNFGRGTSKNGKRTKPIYSITKSLSYSASDNDLLLSISKSVDESGVKSSDITEVRVKNEGNVPAFAIFQYAHWTTAIAGGTSDFMVHYLLNPNEEIILPATRAIIGDADVEAYGGTAVTEQSPDSNMYTDSTANVDSATASGVVGSSSSTTLYLEPYTSDANCTANLFRVGDLIRCTNEIMEVTAIGDKSDLANNYLTVKRGMYGSTAASDHSDADAVLLPFFNAYHDFDKFSVAQTDVQGRFKANNFFGYGRALTGLQGITPGSVAIGPFYNSGYQELGLSGIGPATETGLTGARTYYYKIAVSGGSIVELNVTIDSGNTTFGGSTGLVALLQKSLDDKYYDASSALFEKKVNVQLVGGDVRFTDMSRLSSSAISLTAGTSGSDTSYEFFAAANGRIPTLANLDSAVAAKFPDEVSYDSISYGTSYNNVFIRDDGMGNLWSYNNNSIGYGKISYETGAIDIVGAPALAEFKVNVLHTSAFSGKVDATEATKQNSLEAVYGNITNQKCEGKIRIETY